jgi:gluconolactonase
MTGSCLAPVAWSQEETVPPADGEIPTGPILIGEVVRLDERINQLIPTEATIELLAEGFEWAEGPVWSRKEQAILFSDIPNNVVHQWKEGEGLSDYLRPSGYTGSNPRLGEMGSNGLTLDTSGRLVLAMHGDRRIGRLNSDGTIETLVRYYKYRRFNSPNDLVYDAKGNLYFTDPPYGLEKNMDDPKKELLFQGVYLLRRTGELVLLTDRMTRPNGIDLSPDGQTLYVANSDPKQAHWLAFDVQEDATITNERTFFDATDMIGDTNPGLPDGLKVDIHGAVWATGPGGVLIFTPKGKHIGTIRPGPATANCGFGNDGSTLYMTSDMYLCRIKTLSLGQGF